MGFILLSCRGKDKSKEAEDIGRQALHCMQRVFGFEHATTKQMVTLLANFYSNQGRSDDASVLLEEQKKSLPAKPAALPKPKTRGPISAFVLSLFIAPGHQRKGLGRMVMEHWKHWAKENSAVSLEVCLNPASSACSFFTEGIGMLKVIDSPAAETGQRECLHLRYAL